MDDIRALFENSGSDPSTLRDRISQIVTDIMERGGDSGGELSASQIQDLTAKLPRLTESDLDRLSRDDSLCSICYTPFAALLAEEETSLAMDSPAYPADELGVTKLDASWQCGHLFCRKDISKWIRHGHASCPMCRRSLLESGSPAAGETTGARDDDAQAEDAEMLSQIRGFMEQMRADGGVAYFDQDGDFRGFGERIYEPEGGYVDDRSEFSGMYS